MANRIAASAIAVLAIAPVGALAAICDQTGPNSPLETHKHWIMEGWEKRVGDPEFEFVKKMARYYDLEDPAGGFFDNFAPGQVFQFIIISHVILVKKIAKSRAAPIRKWQH